MQDVLEPWRALASAQALVRRAVEQDLRAEGLPEPLWFDALSAVQRAGGRRRIRALADDIVLSSTGTTRLVDRLEAAGLVSREAVPGDGRGSYATLTAEGLELLRRMQPAYRRALERHLGAPLGEDGALVADVLERVVSAGRTSQ